MNKRVYHKLYNQIGDITIDKMELTNWLGAVAAAIMYDKVNINYYINIANNKLQCRYGAKEGFTLIRIEEGMNIDDLGLDYNSTVKDVFIALRMWLKIEMEDNIIFNNLDVPLNLYIDKQWELINNILESLDIVSDYFQDKKLCDLEIAYEALI